MKLTCALPLAAAAAMVAGCSPMPSTAAEVGGARISEAALDRSVAGCEAAGISAQELPRVAHLVYDIRGTIADQVARRLGVSITGEEALALAKRAQVPAKALQNTDCAHVFIQALKIDVLGAKAQAAKKRQQDLNRALLSVKVEIKPRYGKWDQSTGKVDGSNGSLSIPAAGPATQTTQR